jgi:hypothetical protein
MWHSILSLLLASTAEIMRALRLAVQTRTSLIVENLFLRKQLAFYQEREARPKGPDPVHWDQTTEDDHIRAWDQGFLIQREKLPFLAPTAIASTLGTEWLRSRS